MFALHLFLVIVKVLLLCLDDDSQLSLFSLYLLDQLLKVGNLLEVFDLLRGDLLIEYVLLFLVSDLVFKLALAHKNCFRIQIVKAVALLGY